ncbi:hypothetical protein [Nonomuraea typhae]|uniref:Uncharacterized protein n=1 Tax=Nonomuraea typhae TaxID=2603600 RepID=A0ABW7Z3D4_9ACTN
MNSLASEGELTETEEEFRRRNNDWYNANFTNPSDMAPTIYDRALNPGAAAWFKGSSVHLIDRVRGYLEILDAHDVPCVRVESSDPGRVIYEDADQVVVVPYETGYASSSS